jgi:hypothetical protein
MNNNTDPIISSLRVMNRKAVKEHALRCSAANRAGKFTRVGEDFINEVQADIEARIRQLANENMPSTCAIVPVDEAVNFVSGDSLAKLRQAFDGWVARLIQNKVQRHPSVGCTLQNTR